MAEVNARLGGKNDRVEIILERGETFWQLSEAKYEGRHPIAAIFQANELQPSVVYENGLRRLIDPVYFAGQTYILPAWSEVDELERQFYETMDNHHPPVERSKNENDDEGNNCRGNVNDGCERSFVTLNWDQTLYAVAQKKYGAEIPIEAIYEINSMWPTVQDGPGGKSLREPVYPGGKTYWLPAGKEIESLTGKYKEKVKALMK